MDQYIRCIPCNRLKYSIYRKQHVVLERYHKGQLKNNK